jgi:molecular chaperone GrpE
MEEEVLEENEEKQVENSDSEEISSLKAKIAELEDRVLRAAAELQNVQKRGEKAMSDAARYGISDFARDVLVIRDNLLLALESCADESGAVVDGIKLTNSEIDKVLARHGVRPVDAIGKKFDPNIHQALVEVEDEEKEPGVVVRVMQEGFVIYDRLLRPALVGVSKKK